MDPFAILGVDPGVSERELAAAYRREAKRRHPDHHGGGDGQMVELNAAYERARRTLQRAEATARGREPVAGRRAPVGSWLPQRVRQRLGWELLAALSELERVELIVDAGRSGRGPARLVLTDRRLLWLLEDAVSARVDWIRFGIVADVGLRRPLLRRARRSLHVQTRTGRRVAFGDLDPSAAEAIAEELRR